MKISKNIKPTKLGISLILIIGTVCLYFAISSINQYLQEREIKSFLNQTPKSIIEIQKQIKTGENLKDKYKNDSCLKNKIESLKKQKEQKWLKEVQFFFDNESIQDGSNIHLPKLRLSFNKIYDKLVSLLKQGQAIDKQNDNRQIKEKIKALKDFRTNNLYNKFYIYQASQICKKCKGSGKVSYWKYWKQDCPKCKGSGNLIGPKSIMGKDLKLY